MTSPREIVEGKEPQSMLDRILARTLSCGAAAYGAVTRTREWAYARGSLKSKSLPCPVICVGNLTLGGTGKTPVAAAIVQMLLDAGKKPTIVSRGYRGAPPSREPLVVSDGANVLASPQEAGDEPCLLARLLPQTPIVVSPNRFAAGQTAVQKFDANVIVMDDGYQHLKLHRDINLALLDSTRDPAKMRLFPRGPLREGFRALSRATAIILTRAEQGEFLGEWKTIAERHAPGTPVFQVEFKPETLISFDGNAIEEPSSLNGRSVFALCSIGNPAQFHRTLKNLGAQIVGKRSLPDHGDYDQALLDMFSREARDLGAEAMVATDKDAVKIQGLTSAGPPIQTLRIGADFGGATSDFREMLLKD